MIRRYNPIRKKKHTLWSVKALAGLLSVSVLSIALLVLVGAQRADAQARGVSISPLTFEFRLDPGEVASDVIRVFNGGSEPLVVSLKLEDTAAVGETGQAVIEEAETTSYSIASWTTLESEVLILDPGEQRAVNFTITVPEDAEPGGHYGAFTVEAGPGDISGGGSGIGIAQKVAALMLIAVSGDVEENVTLLDFFISTEMTTIRYDWIPTNWILEPEEVMFVTRFENKGSVHAKPAGFITITNAFNSELAKLPIEQRNVLPDARRVIETTWQPEGLTMGKIRAEVNAIYGSKNASLFAAQTFWVIPVRALAPWVIGGFIGLILIIILRKRLTLALKIIVRGDKSETTTPDPKEKAPPQNDSEE